MKKYLLPLSLGLGLWLASNFAMAQAAPAAVSAAPAAATATVDAAKPAMLQNRQKLQLLWQHLPQPQQPLLRQQHLLLLHQRQFQTKVIPLG
jgi:hypothetical protein